MSIIKKKKGGKGREESKETGKKNDKAEAGIFFPLSALPQWLLFEKLFPSGDGSHWK